MMRVPGIRVVAPVLAFVLTACGAVQAETQARPSVARASPSPSTSPSPSPTPTPHVVIDAAYVAAELGVVEDTIRMADTPGDDYASLGDRQQHAYQLLAAHPDWMPAILNAVSPTARSAIQDNLGAAQQIDSLNGARNSLPHWQIIAPPAPEVLLGYYREAQQAYGVQWQYLAAINLIETNMGRIRGLSSAGAQGPMQFMPATWASYGHGDVNNPHDAIQAAGRYLKAHGAPQNMSRAIYAYNPSNLYVRAVQLYAQQMFANERAFLGYYSWQVYVQTNGGAVLLPEGFSG
ncbi:MAG TPA: lytic transglycosylase domain-containing protein [Candidatus Dormibacteraeota bacterium]|nr:lytic transglycosylase domain-containing protein [Candidatus Dormibacteraeota bacterium]